MNDLVEQSTCVRPEKLAVILEKLFYLGKPQYFGGPLCYSSLAFIALTDTFDVGGKAQEMEVIMFKVTQTFVIPAVPYHSHGLNHQVLTNQVLEASLSHSCFCALLATSLPQLLIDCYYNNLLMGGLL